MDNRLRKNFYCGDEVDYDEQCFEQCENCNDCIGVDYGFLPPEEQCTCKTGEPYNNTCCKVHGSIPKEDLSYTTKMGITVSDKMARALMIPKESFGKAGDSNEKSRLELLVHTWKQQQIQYEALAESHKENEHNFKKYKYKAMATRDCWKELLKTINEIKWGN
jgi:hypothetical protein